MGFAALNPSYSDSRAPMPKQSAGILMYRIDRGSPSVLLVHPGGPFWAKKDLGAWSVPKGEYGAGEDPLAVAIREFEEETGVRLTGDFRTLGEIRQAGGKRVAAWAIEGDLDPAAIRSNVFEIEWPPKSGHKQSFPEIDRADWFALDVAREKINPSQRELIDRLVRMLEQ